MKENQRLNGFASFLLAIMIFIFSSAGVLATNTASGESPGNEDASASFADADSSDSANYAPDRKVDISHLALDITPDFQKRTVQGEVVLTFKPIAKPLEELRLDAVDMTVADIKSTLALSGYQVTDKEIIVTFAEPVPPGQETRLTIRYSAQPIKGLYFRVPSNGYKVADMHIFSQGEMIESRHWFPSYDYPNAKFTSEVTCHVPEGMTVISNGKMVSSRKDPTDGLIAVRWLQDKPHVNYLITLAAGYFSKLEDKYKNIPLNVYTLPCDKKEAPLVFADTKPMVEFFEKEIGVDYPWDKYAQVVVQDFTAVGMENTSLTTLSDIVMHPAETENVKSPLLEEYTGEELIVHELAHQWFGDLVTCKDWSHSWLNEGFATYYTLLYLNNRHGHDQLLYSLYEDLNAIIPNKGEPRAIVYRHYHDPWEQFDQRVYARASWVLHMLHSRLGDDLFRDCVKTYLDRYKYRTVVSSDLLAVVEELSGRSFDRFFDEWIYHSGLPELKVKYSWDEKSRLARIDVSQQKRQEEEPPLHKAAEQKPSGPKQARTFSFPLTLSFKTRGETIERQVQVKDAQETFYFPLKQAPDVVRFDPHLTLLADVDFELPEAMLFAQLADKADLVGRLIACHELAGKKDHNASDKLKDVLQNDPFYGVRIKAADSLCKIHTEEALEALIAGTKQNDARVRNAVIENIAHFYNKRALETLLTALTGKNNPEITASALRGLGSYHESAVHDTLLKYLESRSYRNMLADAAIEAIRFQDDPTFISPLRAILSSRQDDFTSNGFAHGLDTLAYIDRNEKPKDEVRNFIAGFLNHKREAISLAALKALGTLEDPKSIALLQTFAEAGKDTPQHQQAEASIASLRRVNKPNDNLQDLRQEVLNLQKANQEIKKEFADFQKRIKAADTRKKDKKRKAGAGEKSSRKKNSGQDSAKPEEKTNPEPQDNKKQVSVLPPGGIAPEPVPTEAKIAEGKKTFEQLQCNTCHINGGNLVAPD